MPLDPTPSAVKGSPGPKVVQGTAQNQLPPPEGWGCEHRQTVTNYLEQEKNIFLTNMIFLPDKQLLL